MAMFMRVHVHVHVCSQYWESRDGRIQGFAVSLNRVTVVFTYETLSLKLEVLGRWLREKSAVGTKFKSTEPIYPHSHLSQLSGDKDRKTEDACWPASQWPSTKFRE